jgi:hypothetical protein
MKVGRDILLITVALLIDGLQAILGWMAFAVGIGLQVITPAGGAAGGAAVGAYVCWNSTGDTVAALIAAGKCALAGGAAGAVASTFGIPLGTALGFVLEITISLTFGAGLIFLLLINGMYYSTRTPVGFIAELIPGLDILPGWTVMTILCILKKRKEEGKLIGKVSTTFAKMLSPGTTMGAAVGGIKYLQQQKTNAMLANGVATGGTYKQMRIVKRQNINTELKNIDSIKPAQSTPPNNTRPYVQKAA